jgi:hypothetical protein
MGFPQDGHFRSVGPVGSRNAAAAAIVAVLLAGALLVGAGPAAAAPPPFVLTSSHPAPTVQPPARVFTTGATLPDASASLLVGGQVPGGEGTADAWTYRATTGWAAECGTSSPATGPCPTGDRSGAASATGPGGVIVYGGTRGAFDPLAHGGPGPLGAQGPSNALADTWRWDGTTWTQVCDTCAPGTRAFAAMAGNGTTVVLFGGLGPDGPLDDTWVFDGTTWSNPCGSTRLIPCGPPGLMASSMAWDGTRFVLFGGAGAPDGPDGTTPVDDTWTFDGSKWTKVCGTSDGGTACGPPAREAAAFTFAAHPDLALQGAFLAQGGDLFGGGDQSLLRDGWLWHDGAWSVVTTPWDGPVVAWGDGDGGPPPGDWPLLGVAMARPAECQVLYSAAGLSTGGFVPYTYLGGRDLTGDGVPDPCPATTTSTTTVLVAGTTTVPTIARTGPDTAVKSAVIGLGALAIGAACIVGGRRARRSRRHAA